MSDVIQHMKKKEQEIIIEKRILGDIEFVEGQWKLVLKSPKKERRILYVPYPDS